MLDYVTDWMIALKFYNYFKVMNIQLSMANLYENEKKNLTFTKLFKKWLPTMELQMQAKVDSKW